jgi:hypothetical protein
MIKRSYKGATQEASRQDNPTLDFFIKFLNEEDESFNTLKEKLEEFVLEGYRVEGRDLDFAQANAVGFLFVLETSGRIVEEKHIFDALEASIANYNISDEDVSRYAWGILRRIEGWK